MIQRKKIDTSAEKNIITGMIISTEFIRGIESILKIHLLQLPYSKVVARWCLDYFKAYGTAPMEEIQSLFSAYSSERLAEPEMVESIELFLSELSSRYELTGIDFNTPYMLDLSEKYLKECSLRELSQTITGVLASGDVGKAESAVLEYDRIVRPTSDGVDVLGDLEAARAALNEETDVLFRMPGALGSLLMDFCRDDFVAVAAPPKRGKTWWLEEIGLRGLYARRKVWFVSLEMTQNQMLRRIYQSLTATLKPTIASQTISIPYFDPTGTVKYREKAKHPLSIDDVKKVQTKLLKYVKQGKFMLSSFPSGGIKASGLVEQLNIMEKASGFVPDIIIVDYADLLAPEFKEDRRNQIDATWKTLRGIAQSRHVLMVTATHSSRATLKRDLDSDDITEDIRKINHVSCMFALNQRPDDKKAGIMRVKVLASRHEDFIETSEVVVLQQLSIGKPYIDSRWKSETTVIDITGDEKEE